MIEKEEKSKVIVLLKDNLDGILTNFDMSFTHEGADVLKKIISWRCRKGCVLQI